MLRTKEKQLFFDSRAWTPPLLQKIPGSAHGFALGTYNHGSIAYIESVIYLLKDCGLRVGGCARWPVT